MNKSFLTNILAAGLVLIGFLMHGYWQPYVFNTGLFALSGGLTNWLAIHMLFEKVPGLYGSGVIPERFEDFKKGIKNLVMEQFFNSENVRGFLSRADSEETDNSGLLSGLVESVKLDDAFDSLVDVIMDSSFGSMLSMLGGKSALDGLRVPFVEKMQDFLKGMGKDKDILDKFRSNTAEALLEKVELIVEQRLEELTPQMVKDIVQQMIRHHLGWLVIWGGVFGGLIGLVSTFLLQF